MPLLSSLVLTIAVCFLLLRWLAHRSNLVVADHYQYFKDTSFPSHTKHFGANNHVDIRFAPTDPISIKETQQSLKDLLASFTTFMAVNHLEFWAAHGTLLGWYWNERLLPWGTDVDVQVTGSTLTEVARRFNMSTYHWGGDIRREYLLDINPFFNVTDMLDPANTIDAPWIDTINGKFIDITAVHQKGARWECKDSHHYRGKDLFPLKLSNLEGLKISVPQQVERMLKQEYGRRALSNDRFHWHVFNRTSDLWEPEEGI